MRTPLTPQSSVARIGGLIEAPLGDELMMMSVTRGVYFGLNEVGAAIWRQLDATISVGAICAALQAEFAVEPDQCLAEVLVFLEQMRAEGLVDVVG